MRRVLALVLPWILAWGTEAAAQDWAKKMFEAHSHDFGMVARGSKQEYSFVLTNSYKEDVHISDVRSSCGCTTPRVTKDRIKTHEQSAIALAYNTRSFLGAKSATVTVTFDEPYYAEVQLTVNGYIRSDVVFNPGAVEFGSVDAGQTASTKVSISYAGRDDWEITDVRSANESFEVELQETLRSGGRVNYEMVVRLKPDAPPGFIHDQLLIVTNDSGASNVSLPVEGQIVSAITVSPAALFLGVLKPGESVKKRLVVRGSKPFRILSVKCADASFTFEKPEADSKSLHFVPVEFKASDEAGQIEKKIEIETDLGQGFSAQCMASATVKP
jgi:hypothetical protein